MSLIQIELPSELQSELKELGLVEETRLATWVAEAVRRSWLPPNNWHTWKGGRRGNREVFHQVLAKVPMVEPTEEDRW